MRFPREDVSLQWKRRLVGEPVTNRKPLASGAGFIVASIMSGLVRGRLATGVPISFVARELRKHVAKLPSWMMRKATRTQCPVCQGKGGVPSRLPVLAQGQRRMWWHDHSDAYAARTTHSEKKSKLRGRHR